MKKILAIGMICWLMPVVYADLTQEQAREKARVFLVTVTLNQEWGINDLQQRNSRRESDNTLIWPFFCNNGAIRVSIDSTTGEVFSFDDRELALRNEERFKNKEMPLIRSAGEAREKADAMLHKVGPSFSEFQPVVQISTSKWTANGGYAPATVKSIGQLVGPGYWNVKYKRFHNKFEVFGDNCTVWLDLYEGRPIYLRFNWRTPVCETVQNVTREEAIHLTLDGMKQRGLSAVVSVNSVYPRLAILRPNYYWTDYAIPSGSAPFTRLAWIIQVNTADNSTLGTVYIDAASGEWLGGDTVAGKWYALKTVPLQANAKAFLLTRYMHSREASIHIASLKQTITIQPKDTQHWSALGTLLSLLTPVKKAPPGAGIEYTTFTASENIYHLQRVQNILRLEGPDVPGGAIGFAAGKGFEEKLTGIAAPLGGGKGTPAGAKKASR